MSSQTIITLTGDEKSAYEAFKKVIEQAAKLNNNLDNVSKKAKKVKNDFDFAQQGKDAFMGMATSIVSVTGAIEILQLGLEGVRAEYERINEVGRDQLSKARGLAAAQQEASKNLAGVSPEEQKKIFDEVIPKISVDTAFPDQELLTKAFGSASSVVGSDKAGSIVEAAAGLTNLNTEQLQPTSSSLADIVKFSGVKDAKEGMAIILSAGAVARPENIQALAQAISKSAASGVIATATTQDRLSATKDQAALLAMLSEIDPSGNSAGTSVATLTAQMAELFSDLGAEEREKKASDLADKRQRAEESLIKAQNDIEIKTKKAAKFGAATTPEAKAARLEVTANQNEVGRLRKSIGEIDKELSQFASIEAMRKADPGTTTGRLFSVSKNEDARDYFLKNLRGEEVYKPLFTGLVTTGSQQQQNLITALSTVTSDVKAFNDSMTTQTNTDQQKIAREMNKSEALLNAEAMADPVLELARSIKEIRQRTEENVTLPRSWFLAFGRLSETIFSPVIPDSLGSPQIEARYAIDRLKEIITEAEPVGGFTKSEEIRNADMIREQIKIIENLANLASKIEANTEEVRKNNEFMQQDVQTNNTGTIQAQWDKSK